MSSTIKSGETETKIQFDKPFKKRPVINISPREIYATWTIVDDTKYGFTIRINEPLQTDIEFSWNAFSIEQ